MDHLLIEKHHIANYTAMMFYFRKAAQLIEDTPNYPENVPPEVYQAEKKFHISFMVFTYLPALYFSGYYASLQNVLPALDQHKKLLLHKDSIQTLNKMLYASLRCLDRLATLEEHNETLSKIMQKNCALTKLFSEETYSLEKERLQLAKKCDKDIKQCPAYRKLTQRILRIAQSIDDLLTLNSLTLFF